MVPLAIPETKVNSILPNMHIYLHYYAQFTINCCYCVLYRSLIVGVFDPLCRKLNTDTRKKISPRVKFDLLLIKQTFSLLLPLFPLFYYYAESRVNLHLVPCSIFYFIHSVYALLKHVVQCFKRVGLLSQKWKRRKQTNKQTNKQTKQNKTKNTKQKKNKPKKKPFSLIFNVMLCHSGTVQNILMKQKGVGKKYLSLIILHVSQLRAVHYVFQIFNTFLKHGIKHSGTHCPCSCISKWTFELVYVLFYCYILLFILFVLKIILHLNSFL